MRTNVLNVTPRPMEDGMEEEKREVIEIIKGLTKEELQEFVQKLPMVLNGDKE